LLGACSRRQPSFDYGQPQHRYQLRGVVLRLRSESRIAVIKHEKIGDWMEAMTMEFPVQDPADFAKLHEGAAVQATVNVNEAYFWLTDVTVQQ
jgi:Cu/Ag efflux protein CusF